MESILGGCPEFSLLERSAISGGVEEHAGGVGLDLGERAETSLECRRWWLRVGSLRNTTERSCLRNLANDCANVRYAIELFCHRGIGKSAGVCKTWVPLPFGLEGAPFCWTKYFGRHPSPADRRRSPLACAAAGLCRSLLGRPYGSDPSPRTGP